MDNLLVTFPARVNLLKKGAYLCDTLSLVDELFLEILKIWLNNFRQVNFAQRRNEEH